jgi:hypothetical protein
VFSIFISYFIFSYFSLFLLLQFRLFQIDSSKSSLRKESADGLQAKQQLNRFILCNRVVFPFKLKTIGCNFRHRLHICSLQSSLEAFLSSVSSFFSRLFYYFHKPPIAISMTGFFQLITTTIKERERRSNYWASKVVFHLKHT